MSASGENLDLSLSLNLPLSRLHLEKQLLRHAPPPFLPPPAIAATNSNSRNPDKLVNECSGEAIARRSSFPLPPSRNNAVRSFDSCWSCCINASRVSMFVGCSCLWICFLFLVNLCWPLCPSIFGSLHALIDSCRCYIWNSVYFLAVVLIVNFRVWMCKVIGQYSSSPRIVSDKPISLYRGVFEFAYLSLSTRYMRCASWISAFDYCFHARELESGCRLAVTRYWF